MKILITGGHLTPALSVIDFVQQHHSQDKIIFVGREFSQDSTQQKAIERYEVEKRKVPFIAFEAVRLGPTFFHRATKHLARFFASITEAKEILSKQQPQVVLSFGGYVAVPFALAAKLMHIPVVTHEQTLVSGFANRLIGLVANKVAVTFPQSAGRIFAGKTMVTGNPLRAGVFFARHPRPAWLAPKTELPILLVMGGNQGSQILNEVVERSLSELLSQWTVVHQCGRPTSQINSLEVLERSKKRLPPALQRRYYILEWIDENDLFWLYRHAFGAVSRSGANTTQELAVAGLPAVLVPLPSSRRDEQRKNAQWLAQTGGAIELEQRSLNPQTLLHALEKLQTFEHPMRESLAAISLPKNAAERLYELVATASSL